MRAASVDCCCCCCCRVRAQLGVRDGGKENPAAAAVVVVGAWRGEQLVSVTRGRSEAETAAAATLVPLLRTLSRHAFLCGTVLPELK